MSRTVRTVWGGAALVAATVYAAPAAQAQSNPYSLDQVVSLLQGGATGPRVIELVRSSCLSFRVTPAAEQRLRTAGADAQFLRSLRGVCARISGAQSTTRPTRNNEPQTAVRVDTLLMPVIDTVTLSRIDTVTVTRIDTVRITRTDTVYAVPPSDGPVPPPQTWRGWEVSVMGCTRDNFGVKCRIQVVDKSASGKPHVLGVDLSVRDLDLTRFNADTLKYSRDENERHEVIVPAGATVEIVGRFVQLGPTVHQVHVRANLREGRSDGYHNGELTFENVPVVRPVGVSATR